MSIWGNPILMGRNGNLSTKTITLNGEYNARTDRVEGYDKIIVNVPNCNISTGNESPDENSGEIGDGYIQRTNEIPSGTQTFTINITKAMRGSAQQSYGSAADICLYFDDGEDNEVEIRQLDDFTYSSTSTPYNSNTTAISNAFDNNSSTFWESALPANCTLSATVPEGYIVKRLEIMRRNGDSYPNDFWSDFNVTTTINNRTYILFSAENLTLTDWATGTNYTSFTLTTPIRESVYLKTENGWVTTDKIKIGGNSAVLSGTESPDASIGTNGSIYMQYNNPIELPSGYTNIKYITSSGTQYISTDVPARQQLKIEIDFQYTGTSEATLLGGTGSNTSVIYLGINPGSSYRSYYFNWAGSWVDVRNRELTKRHTICVSLKSGDISITEDGTSIYSNTSSLSGTTATTNLTILARDGSRYFFVGNLYSVKIWDLLNNDELIRSFIPAIRTNDNAIGLYETVQDIFYTNSGSGVFVSGGSAVENEVIDTYVKVNDAWQPLIGTSLDDINI